LAHEDDRLELDDRMTLEEHDRVNALSPADVQAIDAAVLAVASDRFQKLFSIVGRLLQGFADARPARMLVPTGYLVRRIAHLAERRELLARGDLRRMGHGEVRRSPFRTPRLAS
jgi:hypothetical protein